MNDPYLKFLIDPYQGKNMPAKKKKAVQFVQKPLPLEATKGGSDYTRKILIRIPLELCNQVDDLKNWSGYKSRNDFIVNSIREHVNRLIRSQNKGEL